MRPLQCPTCGVSFALESSLAQHAKSHGALHVCGAHNDGAACGAAFSDEKGLHAHVRSAHTTAWHTCKAQRNGSECGRVFSQQSMLVDHEHIAHAALHDRKRTSDVLLC